MGPLAVGAQAVALVLLAQSAGPAARFSVLLDPAVTCPERADLDRALGPRQAAAEAVGVPRIRVLAVPGGLRLELRSAAGEVLATRELEPAPAACRERAEIIALIAAAWADAFPAAAVAPPAPPLEPRVEARAEAKAAPPLAAAAIPAVIAPHALAPPGRPFRPGPLSVRLSGVGAWDVSRASLGAGGQVVVELGLGTHFAAGASAALLSNELGGGDSNNPGGRLLLHRQRYTVFGSVGTAARAAQWFELQLGLQDQHFIAQATGYNGALHGSLDEPALAVHAVYGHGLWGPLFAFAEGGADVLLVRVDFSVQDPGPTTLFAVSPVSLDLQIGLGLRLF